MARTTRRQAINTIIIFHNDNHQSLLWRWRHACGYSSERRVSIRLKVDMPNGIMKKNATIPNDIERWILISRPAEGRRDRKYRELFEAEEKKNLRCFLLCLTRWPSIRANIAAMCFMCDTSHSALVSNWMMPIKSCQQNGKWRKFHDSSRMLREHWICEIERVDIPRQSIRHADNYDRIAEVEKYVMLNLGFTVIYAHTEKAIAKHVIKQCCRSRS